jgi:hypothetical protein
LLHSQCSQWQFILTLVLILTVSFCVVFTLTTQTKLQGVLKTMLDRVRASIHATHFTRSASINASASRSNLAAAGANNGGGAVTPGSWLCWSSFCRALRRL